MGRAGSTIFTTLPVGQAYLVKSFHYFKKAVPFTEMFSELTSLQLNLKSMNPSGTDSSFRELQGKTGKFLATKQMRSFTQNSLTCAEIGGTVTSWLTTVAEQLTVTFKTVTTDYVRISRGQLTCDIYNQPKMELACIDQIQSIAMTTGLHFLNGTTAEYYQQLLRTYQDAVLFVILEQHRVYLQAEPMSFAICNPPPATQGYEPDKLTSSMQGKFFNHLSMIFSQILQAYYTTTVNLQHMFTLAIDSKLPGASGFKTVADLCKGIKAMMPSSTPTYSQAMPSAFQLFLENNKGNSLTATKCIQQIQKSVQTLCTKEENKPQLTTISHALTTMNINIQTHLISLHDHMQSKMTLQFPKSFAILLSETSTAQDVQQYLNMVSATQLPDLPAAPNIFQ